MISVGEFVQASGAWVNDRTHGVQFRASFLEATAPTTVEGIEKYLGSGMLCTSMRAEDVTATLDLALRVSGLDQAKPTDRPRLLSDNGSSYERDPNGLDLAFSERQLGPLLDPRNCLLGIDLRPGQISDSQCSQPFGDLGSARYRPARKTHCR